MIFQRSCACVRGGSSGWWQLLGYVGSDPEQYPSNFLIQELNNTTRQYYYVHKLSILTADVLSS